MPQIADRKSMARYICVDKGATHPALQERTVQLRHGDETIPAMAL